MNGFVVLRPEPGNAQTAARLATFGRPVLRLPLFAVTPLAWRAPDPADVDALLFTSANAVRQGGEELDRLRRLPVIAVGTATADAATAAGFTVVGVGGSDATAAMTRARAEGFARLLHLAGRDRSHTAPADIAIIEVYAAEAVSIDAERLNACDGRIALLHSPRAARRFADCCDAQRRGGITIAALSPAVATAAGAGWARIASADTPSDETLVALAGALAD